jgi:hypothetical protein
VKRKGKRKGKNPDAAHIPTAVRTFLTRLPTPQPAIIAHLSARNP